MKNLAQSGTEDALKKKLIFVFTYHPMFFFKEAADTMCFQQENVAGTLCFLQVNAAGTVFLNKSMRLTPCL